MTDLSHLPSQDPVLESFKEDVIESGHDEEIPNEERGCGYLEHNAAYVRSDVHALSAPEGTIPRFVVLEEPIEYREYSGRGAIIPGWAPFPGVEFSLAYKQEGYETSPDDDILAHLERLRDTGFDGDHYGEITAARAHDLLMSVGASNWPTPEAYIEECRTMGLNLKIPSGPSRDPPVVNPLRTRCWIIHPHGVEEDRAGLIGYAYLTRTIFTTGEDATADDPDIPTYAEEWAETGKVHLATPGEEIPAEPDAEADDQPDASIEDFGGDNE